MKESAKTYNIVNVNNLKMVKYTKVLNYKEQKEIVLKPTTAASEAEPNVSL